jgi:branched-chain amino acid aminotransferase
MTANLDTGIQFEIHPSPSRVPAAERARILEAPGFGQVFTDHMITLRWTAERGWHDGKLEPYGPFSLDPATAVFHYGQELFEGLKAYRQDSGSIVMFRPQANARRSCARSSCSSPRTGTGSRPARATASTSARS